MSGFKRFCMVVFALVGLVVLAALILPWIGPWTREASTLMLIDWYFYAVEGCAAVTVLGLLIVLFRALFSPRRVDSVTVASADGGEISVTRAAIGSQAAHIVERSGDLTAKSVDVDIHRRGDVRVSVSILPRTTVDVTTRGAQLHQALVDGLGALCANTLSSVNLEFLEAQTPSVVMPASISDADEEPSIADLTPEPDTEPETEAATASPEPAGDITVPLRDERSNQ